MSWEDEDYAALVSVSNQVHLLRKDVRAMVGALERIAEALETRDAIPAAGGPLDPTASPPSSNRVDRSPE